jgi:hypothetical protein
MQCKSIEDHFWMRSPVGQAKTTGDPHRTAAQRAARTRPIGSLCLGPGQENGESKSETRLRSPIALSSAELARRLLKAALAHRLSNNTQDLITLACLARDAASHVQGIGTCTVDHIVLSSALATIAEEVPAVAQLLRDEGWRWFQGRAT